MKEHVVPDVLAGDRLDRVVSFFTDVSRAIAGTLVDDQQVTVNGVVTTNRSRKVKIGDLVGIDYQVTMATNDLVADPDVAFTVVYADDDVIVVNKPAGLVVHPGAGNHQGTLVQGLLARFPDLAKLVEGADATDRVRPGIVHRLDRGTSGLLMVARTPAARASLIGQLSDRTATRVYFALAWGRVVSAKGLIDAPIGRAMHDPSKMTVRADGRDARTRYVVLERFTEPEQTTLVECRLETGRTHQIRVHLAAIGHPVVGDIRYGGSRVAAAIGINRPFLHAGQLGFRHPRTGEELSFSVPLASDLEEALQRLRGASLS